VSGLDVKATYDLPRNATESSNQLLRDSFVQLDEAEQLRQKGKLDHAQSICEALLRRYPDYFGALHTLGLIYADKRNYRRALDCLVHAAMLDPGSWTTLTVLSSVYLRLNAKEMAAKILEQANLIKPNDANVLVTLGEIYREEQEYEVARDTFSRAVELDPNLLPAAMGLGSSYSSLGQHAEAAQVFEGIIKRGAPLFDALDGLANLPASFVSIDLLSQLDKVIRDEGRDKAEFDNHVAFIRAAALDHAGRHEEAWKLIGPANGMMFRTMQADWTSLSGQRRVNLEALRALPVAQNRAEAAEQPVSLFILGPSRSGKTTVEKLVAILEGVKRGYENPSVENATRRAFQRSGLLTGNWLEQLPSHLYPLCRTIYVEELARRASAAKVFTNTHPLRICDAAVMARIFPNVRFILVKRNIQDNVLRIYMRRYRSDNAYAYNIRTIHEHINWYHQMIDLLAQKFPDIVRVIQYEDVIADPAAALRMVAALCGLPMTEKPLPVPGDDRDCSEPYREFMKALL